MPRRPTSTFPVLAVLAALAMFASGGNCDCVCDDPAAQPQCAIAADCEGRPRPDGGCPEGAGQWACLSGYCVLQCLECVEADDCTAYPWPDGAGCDEADGEWACEDHVCAPRCPAGGCEEDADCEGALPWPTPEERPDLDCTEATGHWECRDAVCEPFCNEQCNATVDCTVFPWSADCEGHFDCVRGRCEEVCFDGVCGDSDCRDEQGETAESCPTDCREPCVTDEDCLEEAWDVPCSGTWDCVGGGCFPVCDYVSCGDGVCDASIGESYVTCRADCEGCGSAAHCVGLPHWPLLCQGHWTCVGGRCNAQCAAVTCGDDVCRTRYGEDGSSCAADCGYGPCRGAVDCLGAPWTAACQARWRCDAAGGCRPDCEAAGCGDGTCDLLGGESPTSCVADCADLGCLTTPQCIGHDLPEGCDGGEWMCVAEVCRPICF